MLRTDYIRIERDVQSGRVLRAVAWNATTEEEVELPPFKGFVLQAGAQDPGDLSIAWGAHRVKIVEVTE